MRATLQTAMNCFPLFDRGQLEVLPLAVRGHDLAWPDCAPLAPSPSPVRHPELAEVAAQVLACRRGVRSVVLMLGGHPVKLGLSRYLTDLVRRRLVTHVAANGAALIHDFELALAGGTSEDVARWLSAGQFGLWQETARLNDVIRDAAARGEGLGQAAGRAIDEQRFPHRDLSLAAACRRAGVPLTCHVTVGGDILHTHPNCDGAALGQASYTDFLIFARTIQDLEGGAFLNVGSAVTGPEVFLKALAMARNVARQKGEAIRHFTTAVFDLAPLPDDWREHKPAKDDPWYYYRAWKTLLVRAVAGGGQSYYVRGDFRQTLPTLWQALAAEED